VRPFHDADELDRLHDSIMDVLVTQARMATWLPEAIQWALWEVMENVLLHAMAPDGGWVQASTFAETSHINIVVADEGVGIRGSLRAIRM
jgi:anti-sigma regulatory factor (Ser/Thr protein kinase)